MDMQQPIISIGHNKDENEWSVDLSITGLKTEQQAEKVMDLLEVLLCGKQIEAH